LHESDDRLEEDPVTAEGGLDDPTEEAEEEVGAYVGGLLAARRRARSKTEHEE